ncbi:hypothetical protein FRACYDRAFT_261575 [Fragilariopsis cylindrus CCMP1102]|uniref:Uncharacterized protein n=1 Tax=Fragilariopsis cylindrus CCMP1102 TaxID=635003 RepID=A0A1E7FAK1_9STRA|nr:hypothetical protein FRACYDRAFT_261575 [Fragilariopsis cylindrus CCMP1102]|eukprot:OEU15212.1 hypothetical protein FRACYDRAFT_261575 [Fragilariopsis cylindrus CCMP1102]
MTSTIPKNDEVERLINGISHALKSSSLLSLMRRSRNNNNNNSNSNSNSNNTSTSTSASSCGISAISQSTLNDHISPIREALERIDPQRLLDLELIPESSLSTTSSSSQSQSHSQSRLGPRIKDGVYCRPICDQIRPKLSMDDGEDDDDGIDMNDSDKEYSIDDRKSVVRYLHIAEVPDQYTIGIFVFGPNECIPLHDHPEMCVLSRVLYGDLQRLSLDLDRGGEEKGKPLTTAVAAAAAEEKGVIILDFLQAPDVAALYPYEGNLHEFVAGPHGAAVLDVLLPPYDDEQKRDCTFYKIQDITTAMIQQHQQHISSSTTTIPTITKRWSWTQSHFSSSTSSSSSFSSNVIHEPNAHHHPQSFSSSSSTRNNNNNNNTTSTKEPCLIIPTGQPENFHCISGRYRDLGESEDNSDDHNNKDGDDSSYDMH